MKFKVGNRVRIKNDCSGCLRDDICALRDGNYKGDQKGVLFAISENKHLMETGKGCSCQENWELVTAKKEKEINPPFYVDCPTEEIWKKVIERARNLGFKDNFIHEWYKNYFVWINDDGGINTYAGVCLDTYKDKKHIPYQEFLGEEDNVGDFKVGDTVKIINTDAGETRDGREYIGTEAVIGKVFKDGTYDLIPSNGYAWYDSELEKVEAPKTATEAKGNTLTLKKLLEIYEESEKYYPPSNFDLFPYFPGKPVKSFTQRIMDTLRSIPDRLKRALNANLRAFYKLGWIDGDLDVTGDGREELTNFLFDKYEKELGAIAMKKVKAASKKKKDEDEEEESEE